MRVRARRGFGLAAVAALVGASRSAAAQPPPGQAAPPEPPASPAPQPPVAQPPPPAAPPVPSPEPAPAGAATIEELDQLKARIADLERRLTAHERADAEEQRVARERAERAAKSSAKSPATLPGHAPWSPFGFADFSWVPGNYGASERPLTLGDGIFVGEFRIDNSYHYSFSNPIDNTISGSSEVFRHNEVQVTQIGVGGDFFYKDVHGRLMTQFGMYSQTTPRNDSSVGRGQWSLADAYRYISEAYAGYHIKAGDTHINVQAGIFMSYVGLWSYYNFDNWTYQPSYVSSNTPWFFNGMRVQIFPSEHVKIEPWLVNGWQAYGKFNEAPGGGLQLLYRPNGWLSVLGNQYFGTDTLGNLERKRVHTDDSLMIKYYDHKGGGFSKAAASITIDAGCEFGGGVVCAAGSPDTPSQFFYGFMLYNRFWFYHDVFGLTVGGGAIDNPGRYLVLLPPINGATAYTGSPYFTENPGDPFQAWDMQLTGDFMPNQYVTFRVEYNHRAASVPYFSGHGGVTPPGGDNGNPGALIPGWAPDLVPIEDRVSAAFLIKL